MSSVGLPELVIIAIVCCVSIIPIGAAVALVVWLFNRRDRI
jgi:hypothetical protein